MKFVMIFTKVDTLIFNEKKPVLDQYEVCLLNICNVRKYRTKGHEQVLSHQHGMFF